MVLVRQQYTVLVLLSVYIINNGIFGDGDDGDDGDDGGTGAGAGAVLV